MHVTGSGDGGILMLVAQGLSHMRSFDHTETMLDQLSSFRWDISADCLLAKKSLMIIHIIIISNYYLLNI